MRPLLWRFMIYSLYPFRETRRWGRKMNVLFCGLVIILAIGLSRLYLGVHYVSDVWSGYLSGFLLLILGIAIVEWRQKRRNKPPRPTASPNIKLLSGILLLAQVGFYVIFALYDNPQIRVQDNQKIVVIENGLAPFENHLLPQFTETLLGTKQEPLSFVIMARDDARLVEVMSRAGWRLADPATPATVFTLAKAAALNEAYPTAPMTPSFWNTVVHDFGLRSRRRRRVFGAPSCTILENKS